MPKLHRPGKIRIQRAWSAQGLAEYGVLLLFVAVAAVAALQAVGSSVSDLLSQVAVVFP